MGHQFEQTDQVEVDATPEQVWEAIATGPGIDSWFMGRNQIDDEHTTVRQSFGGYEPAHRITGWEPLRRLAYGGDTAPDGRSIAYEFLIEGRDQASTTLRMATSGFLPGDDWADEFEMMRNGGALFFATLSAFLQHFPGRVAVPLTVFGPEVTDWTPAWRALGEAFGLSYPARTGDQVRCTPDGLPPVDGEVYYTNLQTIGIRTGSGLYRLMQGLHGHAIASHSVFTNELSETDRDDLEQAWQSWFTKTLPGEETPA
ncbi:SRPBCC family protein [Actinophytocola sediminis]